eukprot:2675460-Pyramimonas_sp.AAC.1
MVLRASFRRFAGRALGFACLVLVTARRKVYRASRARAQSASMQGGRLTPPLGVSPRPRGSDSVLDT